MKLAEATEKIKQLNEIGDYVEKVYESKIREMTAFAVMDLYGDNLSNEDFVKNCNLVYPVVATVFIFAFAEGMDKDKNTLKT